MVAPCASWPLAPLCARKGTSLPVFDIRGTPTNWAMTRDCFRRELAFANPAMYRRPVPSGDADNVFHQKNRIGFRAVVLNSGTAARFPRMRHHGRYQTPRRVDAQGELTIVLSPPPTPCGHSHSCDSPKLRHSTHNLVCDRFPRLWTWCLHRIHRQTRHSLLRLSALRQILRESVRIAPG